jgi:hypothetical protein
MDFKKKEDFKIKIHSEEKSISLSCPDPENLWLYLREFGGIPVNKEQIINIVPVSDNRSNRMYEFKHDGTLFVKDPDPALVVKALDHSGNSSIVVVGLHGEIFRDSTRISLPSDTVISDIEDIPGEGSSEQNPGKTPDGFFVSQNYPNPFNPVTHINFTLPKSEFVTLNIYDTQGIKVTTLVERKLHAGEHSFIFDGSNLASGIYYYEITAGDKRDVRKMVLVK